MLDLPGVTLCCVDTVNHALALRALALSRSGLRFARTLLLTHDLPAQLAVPEGIDVVDIGSCTIASRDDYSRFVLKSLLPHIATRHVLLVQWDGYVVHPDAWDPAFLDCDYLGAKWFWHQDGMRVGNGGFSLRSRKLLEALQDPRIELVGAEDETICRTHRPLLERDFGIGFGSEALADRFSFEAAYPIGRPFGFHGLYNFCRTVAPAELATLAATFSDAIGRSPQLLALLRNCHALGQWQACAAIARRIVATGDAGPEVHQLLAAAERSLAAPQAVGRNEPCPCGSGRKFKQCHGALGSIAGVAAATPPAADALARSALNAHQRGDLASAEAGYRQALATNPGHPLATHYLGVIHYQRGQIDVALPLLEAAVAASPEESEFHNNLGLALTAADRYDDAVASFRRALALKLDHAGACNNLGLALQALNRLPEAIAAFRQAVALAPQFGEAHWNLACALLLGGEYAEGWREYEWRLTIPRFRDASRKYAQPRWDGTLQPGLTLLLSTEQGLGDALQFIRHARPLAESGMRVLVHAQQPLAALLASAPGVAAAYGPEDALPHFDAHLPLLSLPGLLQQAGLRTDSGQKYLSADPQRRARVAARLDRDENRIHVGLAWSGNPAHANDRRRSVRLARLAPLFALEGVTWHSLQMGDAAAEIASVPAALDLVPLPQDSSFDDTAALVAELDLVVAVDTSVAHLAGALGKAVWILLPFAPDWRWLLEREDTPWYPTARLFRQPAPADWATVVAAVGSALRAGKCALRK